ncbi:hypothetical protein GHT06_010956 [Daphnia sinensis]|uniref:RING-type domain-containing protein n=1 Tax=Daphnia sinensis TaxID=1820382 RepID=A0AAD5LT38_9CRUS|nr:hypothetical protein GHT06_010956 [Daphnia sinensis]
MACKSSSDEEEKDFLVCGICMEYYDTDDRTPKILECFHSCCVTCLKLQAVTSLITCPYCRNVTKIKNGVDNMTSNFYIMPKIQKMVAKRKTIEQMLADTKNNFAESIAKRRDVQSKLKMVHNALKLIENTISKMAEDNNEKIAILQSLLEDPFSKQDIEELLASYSKCEADHKYSKEELDTADSLGKSLSDIENFMCCLTLKKKNDGTNYNVKALEKKILAFNNKSPYGPHIGSYHSVLTFILFQMREEKLWEEAAQNGERHQACEVEPTNGKSNKQHAPIKLQSHLFLGDSSDDDWSTTETESSSEQKYNMCYMQFKINNTIQPKVVFRLNFDEAPMMSKRFMDYCKGSTGLSYKSCSVFMNKDGESFTAGRYEDLDIVLDDGGCASSLPNGWCDGKSQRFIADHSTLDEVKGALRMRHRGRSIDGVYVCSEFSVICRDHPNNSQKTTVFGYVHSGIEICQHISRLNLNQNDVVIHSCGVE